MKTLKIAMLIAGIMVALLALNTLAQPTIANIEGKSALVTDKCTTEAHADLTGFKMKTLASTLEVGRH